jgi:hypothetical protein
MGKSVKEPSSSSSQDTSYKVRMKKKLDDRRRKTRISAKKKAKR